jgi:hypothetical protein
MFIYLLWFALRMKILNSYKHEIRAIDIPTSFGPIKKKTFSPLVRNQTVPPQQPPLVCEISDSFSG